MQNGKQGLRSYFCPLHKLQSISGVLIGISICGCGDLPRVATNTGTVPQAAENTTAALSLSPSSGIVGTGEVISFSTPFGPFPVQWSVNGIAGGNSVVGTVDEKGTYTAPLVPPADSVILLASLADAIQNPTALSASAAVRVVNPIPVISQISPNTVPLGSSQTQMMISGQGFNPGSTVSLNGQITAASFVDPAHLVVGVPASLLSTAGFCTVTVSNGEPGGGSSGAATFAVTNPPPRIDAITPSAVFAGSGSTTVTISGTGYLSQSSVLANGQLLSSTLNGDGTLSIDIPAEISTSPGLLPIVVANPGPGGGSSSPQSLTVLAQGQVQSTGNPQVASYLVNAPDAAHVSVQFGEQDYSLNTSSVAAPAGGGQVRILVAGMKPNAEYHMRALLQLPDGTSVADTDHLFDVGSWPPSTLPSVSVSQTGLGTQSPGIQLFDDLDKSGQRTSFFATDREGNIIWAYQGSVSLGKLLDDGTLIAETPTELTTFNLAGETLDQIQIGQINAALAAAGYSFQVVSLHHDLLRLSNRHYIVLANYYKTVLLVGETVPTQVLGDVLIDLDPNLNITWFWNGFDHLDVNRHPVDSIDWTHSNSIQYLPADGNLLLSMRHQSWVIKIDYQDGKGSGDVLWRLGWQGDFSLPGAPLGWFYLQHYANPFSDDGSHMRIALFDNGDNRILDLQGDQCGAPSQIACYSRAVILNVDEQAMTAAIEFESHLGLYSFWGGSAQQMENGNFIAGITVTSTGGRAEEITTTPPGEVVWQMDVFGQNVYRSLRIPSLYPGVEWP